MTAQTQAAGTAERIAGAWLALLLSAWVVSVFLSHWSVLDGWPATDSPPISTGRPTSRLRIGFSRVVSWLVAHLAVCIALLATLAFATLSALLLTMGFLDEWRNISLAVPLLLLLLAERPESPVAFRDDRRIIRAFRTG